MIDTLSFNPSGDDDRVGWITRWSYDPEWMTGMGNTLYTFKNGEIYKHDDPSVERTTFYGEKFPAHVITEFNDEEQSKKMFKTVHLYSSSPWAADLMTDLGTGSVKEYSFVKKEGDWFAHIRRNDTPGISSEDELLLSTKGIGSVNSFDSVTNVVTFNSGVDVLSVSSGDKLYKLVSGVITFVGDVLSVESNLIELTNVVSTLSFGNFVFIGKNKIAESFGLRGYYMSVKLSTVDDNLNELFAVNSSVFKSYP